MNKAKMMARVLLVSALVGLDSLSFASAPMEGKAQLSRKHKKKTVRQAHEMHKRTSKVVPASGLIYTVTATTYQAVVSQTDDEPFKTADNTTIKGNYSSRLHWLAVSRDLLERWGGSIHYGDKVDIRGVSPKLDGLYTVHDTMHKRFKHCIDILSHPDEKLSLLTKNVKMRHVSTTASRLRTTAATSRVTSKSRRMASRSTRHRSRMRAERQPTYLANANL